MDAQTREGAIGIIVDYHRKTDDTLVMEIAGWLPCGATTADVAHAVLVAVLPLLSDDDLNLLVRHVAEVLVGNLAPAGSEVQP